MAGALTAGVGAANVAVSTEKAGAPDPTLAAIEIPIIDIDETVGPLTVIRQLGLFFDNPTNKFLAGLDQGAATVYDLPGLQTNFRNTARPVLSLVQNPGQSIGIGLDTPATQIDQWRLLDVASGAHAGASVSSIMLEALTGGAKGIGAAANGSLLRSSDARAYTLGNAFLGNGTLANIGNFGGEVSAFPFDGFKAAGDLTAVDAGSDTTVGLGSASLRAKGAGALAGGANLCLGSAAATSCMGEIAGASVGAPVTFGVTLPQQGGGETNIISGDFSKNGVFTSLNSNQFVIKGAIGGTVTIGSTPIGRPIPIDIEIPRTSSMLSSTSSARQQSVRDSFMAVPRKSGSDNDTGGRHRATPVRDAVDTIKKAVNDAVSGKHSAKDSESEG